MALPRDVPNFDLDCVVFSNSNDYKTRVNFASQILGQDFPKHNGTYNGIAEFKINAYSLEKTVKLTLWSIGDEDVVIVPGSYRPKPPAIIPAAPKVVIFVYDVSKPNLDQLQTYAELMKRWYGDKPSCFYVVGLGANIVESNNAIRDFAVNKNMQFKITNHSSTAINNLIFDMTKAHLESQGITDVAQMKPKSNPATMFAKSEKTALVRPREEFDCVSNCTIL